jgi:glycosyltransferase involved in cell wall biosynthesis
VKKPYILAAGRAWDEAKNISALDTIAEELTWPVYVAGDTAAPSSCARQFARLRVLGRLPMRDVQQVMSEAAIYALPARYEPFGLSVLEAALSGCALVLGDIASLRENWSDVARFVHPERPHELRNALQDLIDHPEEREQLGAAARRRAEAFDPTAHAAAYESLYREMVITHGRITDSSRAL